jgi:hypothetical protein
MFITFSPDPKLIYAYHETQPSSLDIDKEIQELKKKLEIIRNESGF